MVLLDDIELNGVEVHEDLIQAPGHVRDDQTHEEQEARLRDKECQPLHTLRLKCQELDTL